MAGLATLGMSVSGGQARGGTVPTSNKKEYMTITGNKITKGLENSTLNLTKKEHTDITYKPAQPIDVRVRFARNEGIYVDLPGGTGIVSPRCFGGPTDRMARIEELRPGQALHAIVKSWDPCARSASLVLPGFEDHLPTKRSLQKAWQRPGKPDFEPIRIGTVMIFDTANLLGDQVDYAGHRLQQTKTTVVRLGYRPVFLLEHRAYLWMLNHQPSKAAATEFDRFVADNVSLVNSEADLVMLQLLRRIPNACSVTNDQLIDYAKAFGGIVGTSKIRSFSMVNVGPEQFLSIDGLTEAIPFTASVAIDQEADSESIGFEVAPSPPQTTEGDHFDGGVSPELDEKWIRLRDRRYARQTKERWKTSLLYRAYTIQAA